ncbi:hypothetical protein [Streptomyces sp. A5-4]|uniref:hypothetical protein n=1 Tax=Streptomyces sp. A5-4 TaxID=3384771 RepID=UPI003DA7FC11
MRSERRWGSVVFEDNEGRDVVNIPLSVWLPEADLAAPSALTPVEVLRRTGIADMVERLGVPLTVSKDPQAGDAGGKRRSVPGVASQREMPRWAGWVRGLGMLVWFVSVMFTTVVFGDRASWAAPLAAVALFLVPVTGLAVRVLSKGRASKALREGGLQSPELVVRPSPEPGSGATRRFCGTASVRILPGDIVLTDGLGNERWLARSGSHSVSRAVRVLHPKSGVPLGVEFQGSNGDARALLPWKWWFAGPHGPRNWESLVAELSCGVVERKMSNFPDRGPWFVGHLLAMDAHRMSSLPPGEARSEADWYSSVVGRGESIIVPVLSAPLLAGLFQGAGNTLTFVAGLVSALTIVAAAGPAVRYQIASRFFLDRPAAPETA